MAALEAYHTGLLDELVADLLDIDVTVLGWVGERRGALPSLTLAGQGAGRGGAPGRAGDPCAFADPGNQGVLRAPRRGRGGRRGSASAWPTTPPAPRRAPSSPPSPSCTDVASLPGSARTRAERHSRPSSLAERAGRSYSAACSAAEGDRGRGSCRLRRRPRAGGAPPFSPAVLACTTGRTRPSAIIGQTCSRTPATIAPFPVRPLDRAPRRHRGDGACAAACSGPGRPSCRPAYR